MNTKSHVLIILCSLMTTLTWNQVSSAERPKLQIINGSSKPVDIFWLKFPGERVPNGSVAPGKNTMITTTIGHQFVVVSKADGTESIVTSEVPVQAFRFGGVPSIYTQQSDASGFPIVASANVSPFAVREAVYIVDQMLAKRPDVRNAMIQSGARLCIMAYNEFTTDLPEWEWLANEPEPGFEGIAPRDYRDARARGMGGSPTDPYCSCAEENLLGYEGDPYSTENILIHELAHNIHLRGMTNVDPTFDKRVKAAYEDAKQKGLWKGKYASINHHEYFAEGVQSWFDDNRENDHDHNHVNTRAELIEYDSKLADLCREVFGDTEFRYTKPATRLSGHLEGFDPRKAPKFAFPPRLDEVRKQIRAAAQKRSDGEAKKVGQKTNESSPSMSSDSSNRSSPPTKLPNILLILADDLGYGDVSCYNDQAKVATPNIDKLAREGMRFTDAHSPCTVCTPTRYGLMTGQMPFRVPNGGTVFTGVGGPSLIAPGRLTLPRMLRSHGYATSCVGKWHVGMTFFDKAGQPVRDSGVEAVKRVDFSRRVEGGPVDHGFDHFFGTACCPTTDWLYAFIENDRVPVPPDRLIDKTTLPRHTYANDCRTGMIAPDFRMEEVDLVFLQKSREFIEQHIRATPDKPFFLYHSSQAVHLPSFAAPQFKGKSNAGPHGDFILELDYVVGELMTTLEKLGVADNTVVIFTSDNGPETTSVIHMRADHGHDGARPWRGVKRDSWEGGHRVPFIVRWPNRIKPNQSSTQLTSLTDVMATLAGVVGMELPKGAAEDSFNLLPAWLDNQQPPIRPYLLQQAFGGKRTLSIRRGPWKYIDHTGSGGNKYDKELKAFALPESAPTAPGQLYDLDFDPGETKNLYDEKPGLAKELRDLLRQLVAD